MKLKLARTTLKAKPKTIELKKLEEELANRSIFYFDKDNSHKDLLELQDHYEAMGKSFYMSEVKYGLADNDYMYQVHIMR